MQSMSCKNDGFEASSPLGDGRGREHDGTPGLILPHFYI